MSECPYCDEDVLEKIVWEYGVTALKMKGMHGCMRIDTKNYGEHGTKAYVTMFIHEGGDFDLASGYGVEQV